MLRSGVRFWRRNLNLSKRSLYADVKPHSKLLIDSSSAVKIECLPPHEADRSCVIIPDSSHFCVKDKWRIVQQTEPLSHCPSKIRLPAHRELEIIQNSDQALSLFGYEGPMASIKSRGPVSYKNIKVSDVSIECTDDVSGTGYLEGNLNLKTSGSFYADNLTSKSVNICFGGSSLIVQSAYCESMDINWTLPKEPEDGVTPAFLPDLNIHFGTLHGDINAEVAGNGKFSIGSFEGTLQMRQRFGSVSLHVGGPCPLLQIDLAEGDVELSLPIDHIGEKICGICEIQASEIEIAKDSLPRNCLDNWELGEIAEAQTLSCNFNNPDTDSDNLWRIRTLRGKVRLSGATWVEAMTRNMNHASVTS